MHPYYYGMAANNDPQPSTSNGNPQQNGQEQQLERTRTSTLAPLSDAEMAQLRKELGSDFGGSSGNPGR